MAGRALARRGSAARGVEVMATKHERVSNVGIVGMGDMGSAVANNLIRSDMHAVLYNRTHEKCVGFKARLDAQAQPKVEIAGSTEELFVRLRALNRGSKQANSVVWAMLPAGAMDEFILGIRGSAMVGDILIDGANSTYSAAVENYEYLAGVGVHYLDVGFAGGPTDARNRTARLLVGGEEKAYRAVESVFKAVAGKGHYGLVGGPGAGQLIKGITNAAFYAKLAIDAEMYAYMSEICSMTRTLGVNQEETCRLVSEIPHLTYESMKAGADAMLNGKLPDGVPTLKVSEQVKETIEEAMMSGMAMHATESVLDRYDDLSAVAKRFYAAMKHAITGH